MASTLPKYGAPPVIETAMSAQFARLVGYSSAHAGWFWKSYLPRVGGAEWPKANDVARLEDQFERIGVEEWGRQGLRFGPMNEPQRTQIVRADEERMLQLQDSRLILNWKKQSAAYPSYSTLSREFFAAYDLLGQFATDAGLGVLQPNQWEVTYVNNIPRGDMWESPNDWPKIMPAAIFPPQPSDSIRGETFSADWRYQIGDRGRLYVSLRHAKMAEEVMQLVLTARGPVDVENGMPLKEGFDLGHESIVKTFTAITSPAAHSRWKRTV